MRRIRKEWLGVIAAAVVACALVLPQTGMADYIANAYMLAVLNTDTRISEAYPDTFNEYTARIGTESLDSTTIWIGVDDGTRTVFITPNSATAVVYGYDDGAIIDSMRIKAGTGFCLYVDGRDSLRVERPEMTRLTWVKNPSYEEISGGYMNAFGKAYSMSHGDTLASGGDEMSYSARLANLDADHPGHCHVFNTIHILGYGTSNSNLVMQAYHDGHLIGQFKVASGVPFHSDDWSFDSLLVTTNGNVTYASFSVSWNNGEF